MEITAAKPDGNDETDVCQVDEELAALSSIYGDDFCFLDDGGRSFRIQISADRGALLTINLPVGYPSTEAPSFSLTVPCVRGEARQQLDEHLHVYIKETFRFHCFLYEFIEKAREFLLAQSVYEAVIHETARKKITEKSAEHARLDQISDIPLPEIFHGEPFTERRSTFQAHLAIVHSVKEAHAVLRELKRNRKMAEATHNILAYRISGLGDSLLSDCDDDGESQAGSRLLHLLNIVNARDVVVIVSRWFGGILLGPERFKHITNAARDILTVHGIITAQRS